LLEKEQTYIAFYRQNIVHVFKRDADASFLKAFRVLRNEDLKVRIEEPPEDIGNALHE
jgi:hypothetical protein